MKKQVNSMSLDNLTHAVESCESIDISNKETVSADTITIIKRKGHKEPYMPKKMKRVCMWATGDREYMADELIRDTEIKLHKEIHIKDMFRQLIVTAVNKISMLQPMWESVAARLQLMEIYKETYDMKTSEEYPSISHVMSKGLQHKIYDKKTVEKYSEEDLRAFDEAIDPSRDLLFNYKGLVTFHDKNCLNYSKTKKLELPQHTYMRVAMALMVDDGQGQKRVKRVIEEYNGMSSHEYTRATPIMLNSLTPGQQLSSCVLNSLSDDSHSILDTGKNLGIYSKFKGGTALDIGPLRAKGGYIEGTQGYSSGPVPFMKFYESIMKAWNQGGKRPGALAVYFNWWHLDVYDLLSLKSNGGTDENRARGLKYAVKVNQCFLDSVLKDEEVTLLDPKEAPGLSEKFGVEFEKEYARVCQKTNVRKKVVKARDLWTKILKERSETGNIYMFHVENVNDQSLLNRYVGSSNLCLAGDTEVVTSEGTKTLKDVKVGDSVWSMDTATGQRSFKKVLDHAMTNPKTRVMRVTDERTGKSIKCTPDHQVWTKNRGYVVASDLKPTDTLDIA